MAARPLGAVVKAGTEVDLKSRMGVGSWTRAWQRLKDEVRETPFWRG